MRKTIAAGRSSAAKRRESVAVEPKRIADIVKAQGVRKMRK
jgi:hypothetical protein